MRLSVYIRQQGDVSGLAVHQKTIRSVRIYCVRIYLKKTHHPAMELTTHPIPDGGYKVARVCFFSLRGEASRRLSHQNAAVGAPANPAKRPVLSSRAGEALFKLPAFRGVLLMSLLAA